MQFGEFSVNLAAGEVYRDGAKIKLQELPFRVLAELVSRPGEVVSRDELRARLWDASTFVDAEAGLNTAVAKLRDALGDSADAPRFIETIPKRGYRFIASVQSPASVQGPASVQSAAPVQSPGPVQRPRNLLAITFVVLAILVGVATIVSAVMMARAEEQKTTIAVVLFHNETGDADMDRLAQQLTDATVVALAGNSNYAVIGNAPILRTPRIFEDVQKVGDELHADYVLLGQLQNPASGLTVRVHFIDSSTQKHLWAKGVAGLPGDLERRVVQTVLDGTKATLGK
jgi:DNA-binding winged helix-turn-helix (wHTH) protein/TolB-like protein